MTREAAAGSFMGPWRRFKPHLLMVLVQFGYAFLYFMAEASFKHGLNPHVYITYRNIVAGFVMLPFAYFLERRSRPPVTLALSMEMFIISLLGLGLTPNMFFASLRYTSPTFIACMYNAIACLTFVMAIILRLELLDLRSPRGISKVVGTLVSMSGVIVMTMYKGPIIRSIGHPLIHMSRNRSNHENWLKGSILAVMSCLGWSLWFIMQGYTMKRYPAHLSLATWMNFIGAAQSAVLAVIVEHKLSAWTIGFNIELWTIIYSGVVVSALLVVFQLWCTREKGPVFVTMFNPLNTLSVAVLAYFVLDEKLYTGSILGGLIVIVGLYLLLWGKEGDQKKQDKSIEQSHVTYKDGEDLNSQNFISLKEGP